jgi:HK97 family phage portal protein
MLVSGGTTFDLGTGFDLADSSPARMQSYWASSGIPMAGYFAAYSALYKAQPWVYVPVRKLGTSASRVPVKVYDRASDTDRKLLPPDAPYAELMRRPNERMGAVQFWLWVQSTQELYGEAMAVKLRDDRKRVRELLPLHPSNMIIYRSEADGRLKYGYQAYARNERALVEIDEAEIVHWKGYNPDTTMRGVSPCEPLRQTLFAEDAMRRGSIALWRNGARPSVVLSTDKTLSKGAIERVTAQWSGIHGGVDNWAKTAILEEGMKPQIMQLNSEELQYVQARALNRDECCSVWDVPPPALQVLDRATFSNITEQMRSLYRETMAPRFEANEDVLATQLAPDFDPLGTQYAEFDMDSVLRGSPEQRAAANAQRIGTAQATPAEVRAEDNLPFIEGSDQLLVNAALVPLKVVEQVALPSGDDVIAHPQAVKGLSASDARTIAGRMRRATTLEDIDHVTLLRGIESDPEQVLALLGAARQRGASVAELRTWIAAAVDHDSTEEVAS